MVSSKKILFLQLPRLVNETQGPGENIPLAGRYLAHALEMASSHKTHEVRFLTREEQDWDDHHLLDLIRDWQPNFIACTLYLWNIERTLHLLKQVRVSLPHCRLMVGGPEVARVHPFLFKSRVPDVVVTGEGEAVFPQILHALGQGTVSPLEGVAWKCGGKYSWGMEARPPVTLNPCLPPPHHPQWRPDDNGMAYLETGRGCMMACAYCRYPGERRKPNYISPSDVTERARILMDRGAREIRFVDPTLNGNPQFREILIKLKEINGLRQVRFFAEVHAHILTEEEIDLLAAANFTGIEVGVQSLDAEVLRHIHRPDHLKALERNVHHMLRRGTTVTLDLMYGLPGQRKEEVISSLRWARQFKSAYVQCLQTLLLPGTELRRKHRQWHMVADPVPPYAVRSTDSMSFEDICDIEEEVNRDGSADSMTGRFVGYRLLDLFPEKGVVSLKGKGTPERMPGVTSRRALMFAAQDLFLHRKEILEILKKAICEEPHVLWQFVLNPQQEEPLDLIEEMVGQIRRHPGLWMDRFGSVAGWDRIASRRVFVLLRRGRQYSSAWLRAAEGLLQDHFY